MRQVRSGLFAAFVVFFLVGFAHAVTLPPDSSYTPLPGTTAAAESQLAGLIIVDEVVPFSFSAYGGTVSGDVRVRIVRSNDGTLDFYWRLFNDGASSGNIGSLRLANFISPEYNANYRNDGLGDTGLGDNGPDWATLFASPIPPGYVNFGFTDASHTYGDLQPGTSSKFFFLDTSATSYAKTAFYDVATDYAKSTLFSTYAPVPEPTTILLLVLGLMGVTGIRRKLKK